MVSRSMIGLISGDAFRPDHRLTYPHRGMAELPTPREHSRTTTRNTAQDCEMNNATGVVGPPPQ